MYTGKTSYYIVIGIADSAELEILPFCKLYLSLLVVKLLELLYIVSRAKSAKAIFLVRIGTAGA